MKITLNKKYIEDYQMDRVKEEAKDFAKSYTEKDLLMRFMDETGIEFWWSEIIKTKIEAFDSGWACGNKTTFEVEMWIESGVTQMFKIRFYIDYDLTVDTRELDDGVTMYDVRKYELT